MHRLGSLLGLPQRRFASAHVVGTNGKSSTARLVARLSSGAGSERVTGSYLSPHLDSWRERIEIGGEPIGPESFLEALTVAEEAAGAADRAAPADEGPVTQYELLTAAAFIAFADAGVEVAAIEAGLGGRLDATNVIPSKVTVLTSIGLDHTEWLGDTVAEIAAEKLAVLRDQSVLVTGPDLSSWVEPVVERFVSDRSARWVIAEPYSDSALAPFQQRNLGLALAAAEELVGDSTRPAREVAREVSGYRGRFELRDGGKAILDVAHNPDACRSLAEALREELGDTPVVCALAVLDDKDAGGMIEALSGACESFVVCEIPDRLLVEGGRPGASSRSAADLAAICESFGKAVEIAPSPAKAIERARDLAADVEGVALVTGSHYLLGAYGQGSKK